MEIDLSPGRVRTKTYMGDGMRLKMGLDSRPVYAQYAWDILNYEEVRRNFAGVNANSSVDKKKSMSTSKKDQDLVIQMGSWSLSTITERRAAVSKLIRPGGRFNHLKKAVEFAKRLLTDHQLRDLPLLATAYARARQYERASLILKLYLQTEPYSQEFYGVSELYRNLYRASLFEEIVSMAHESLPSLPASLRYVAKSLQRLGRREEAYQMRPHFINSGEMVLASDLRECILDAIFFKDFSSALAVANLLRTQKGVRISRKDDQTLASVFHGLNKQAPLGLTPEIPQSLVARKRPRPGSEAKEAEEEEEEKKE